MNNDNIVITMRAARVNAGLSQRNAANMLGINADTLWRYEKDSTTIPRNIVVAIEKLYKIPSNNIFFGIESEYIRNLNTEKMGV